MTTGRLYKVQATGNDFVLGTGEWADRLEGEPELVARLCHRHFGFGGDGALAISVASGNRLRLVYRNCDGSRAVFCANGTRCAARAGVELLGLAPELLVSTGWGDIPARVDGSTVTLDLPAPSSAPRSFDREGIFAPYARVWLFEVGVHHLVILVDEPAGPPEDLDLRLLAPPLAQHPRLGVAGANVNFVSHGDGQSRVRTWELGVGETLCCGSGVVASALLIMAEQESEAGPSRQLKILPRSGDPLFVEALGAAPLCRSRLTGSARVVGVLEPSKELLGRP